MVQLIKVLVDVVKVFFFFIEFLELRIFFFFNVGKIFFSS